MTREKEQTESYCHAWGRRAHAEQRPGSPPAGRWRWRTGWYPRWNGRAEEHWRFQALWWAGTLLWAGLVFGADSLGWLPQIGQADAWTWVLLGAGLYGLVGSLYRQASVDTLNPRTWDYAWAAFLLIVGLGRVAGVTTFWPLVLILIGAAFLVSSIRRG